MQKTEKKAPEGTKATYLMSYNIVDSEYASDILFRGFRMLEFTQRGETLERDEMESIIALLIKDFCTTSNYSIDQVSFQPVLITLL